MASFEDIKWNVRRLCSDFAAGNIGLASFERGTAELLRRRAGCTDVRLWRTVIRHDKPIVACFCHAIQGELGPPALPPPIDLEKIPNYVKRLEIRGYIASQQEEFNTAALDEAKLLQGDLTFPYLHFPTYYNGKFRGVICFSDRKSALDWSGTTRRDIKQLITLITFYVTPLQICRLVE